MSATRKLFIASVLLATGLGVAYLLGEPAAIKQALDRPSVTSSSRQTAAAPGQSAAARTWSANRVQLLPEPVVKQTQTNANVLEAPSLQSPLVPIPTAPIVHTDSQFVQSVAVNNAPVSSRVTSGSPVVKLRNEAPRPIGNEPRSPATIRRMPIEIPETSGPASGGDAYKTMTTWPASPQVLSTGFASEAQSTPAIASAYDVPAIITDGAQGAPPSWPGNDEASETHIHVVVDGDSLGKLADHYLADAHRGAEIFEINREVLNSPDLLPIGVELKIPDRTRRTSWDRQGRRAGFPNDAAVREAASGNLVPVRPISSNDGVVPRAQLAPPVAAE